ncbi:MAG: hypothetical protein PHO63_01395 [Bacilli bacterium]|nr:hypothetical protein [Bacilli bacterium]
MSYNEYNDMFLKCQDSGPYKMYTYDVIDSKKIKDSNITTNLYNLIFLVMDKIRLMEEEHKILYDGNDLVYRDVHTFINDGNLREPMLLGDAVAFTVYRDTIDDEVVDFIFESSKEELGIN